MKILVLATDDALNEFVLNNPVTEIIRAENMDAFLNNKDADAYFNLMGNAAENDYSFTKKSVFINSVSTTLKKMNAAENIYRINGWNSFIKRNSWEVAGNMNEEGLAVLNSINKQAVVVPDEPGFIAASIISMIINEAYCTVEEGTATREDIDLAMKLGTNYPFGPFEWGKRIGLSNICALLEAVRRDSGDDRYKICPLLINEAQLS